MANQYNACPNCGGQKRVNAKLCYNCSRSDGHTRHRKESCPVCGRPKLISSVVCRSCKWRKEVPTKTGLIRKKAEARHVDISTVSIEFAHQFIGLLLGEGCVRFHSRPEGNISCAIQIKLRADDAATLKELHNRLGGSFGLDARKDNHSPEARWTLCNRDDIESLLKFIRPLIILPMRKVQEIDLMLEYIEWRKPQHPHLVDHEVTKEFYARMAQLKELQEPDLSSL